MHNCDISQPPSKECLETGWQSYCTCDLMSYGNSCFLKISEYTHAIVFSKNRKPKQSSSASEVKSEVS